MIEHVEQVRLQRRAYRQARLEAASREAERNQALAKSEEDKWHAKARNQLEQDRDDDRWEASIIASAAAAKVDKRASVVKQRTDLIQRRTEAKEAWRQKVEAEEREDDARE